MKKIIILLSFLLVIPTFSATLNENTKKETIKVDKIEYKNNANTIDQQNQVTLNKVATLQSYAEQYKQEKGVSTSVTELCLQFIRKDKYTGDFWTLLLGSIDNNFISYVSSKDSSFKFTTSDIIIDRKTGKTIDFLHMSATLNTYYKKNTSGMIVSPHYAGWAGDLMTLLEEVVNYRINNSITDTNVLTTYTNSILGTNKSSTFKDEDALADIDAINLSNINTISTNLHETLVNYYITTPSNSASNVYTRFDYAKNHLGSESTIRSQASQLISNTLYQKLLIDNSSSVTTSDVNILSQAFADYVYEKGYIEITETEGTITIGTNKVLNIKEKHMQNATFTYDNSIVDVTLFNSKLTITPKKYGTTTITITSPVNGATDSYKVSVKNIAPSIKKDLEYNKTITPKEKISLSIEAEGTENKYTWYISDNETSNKTVLKETTSPNVELEISSDMNNKYIHCGIKNDGNTEIFTKAVQLKVLEEETEETEEITPPIEEPEEDKTITEEIKEKVEDIIEEIVNPETLTPTLIILLPVSVILISLKTIKFKKKTSN